MKKKISMKYLLQHADSENLERIANDYPAPETRKKELFPEYADSETFEVLPMKHSVRWSAVLSVAAAFAFIFGNALLFTHLPKPQQQAEESGAEESVSASPSVSSQEKGAEEFESAFPSSSVSSQERGETSTERNPENFSGQTTVASEFSGKSSSSVTIVSGTEKKSGTSPESSSKNTGKTTDSTKTTQTETVSSTAQDQNQNPIQENLPVEIVQSSGQTSDFWLEAADLDENGLPVLPGFRVKWAQTNNLPDSAIQIFPLFALNMQILERYRPSYLPEGFSFKGEEAGAIYSDLLSVPCEIALDGKTIQGSFFQKAKNAAEASIDNVSYNGTSAFLSADSKFYPINISGNYGYFKINHTEICLNWVQNGYLFGLCFDDLPVSYIQELLKIAGSVQIESSAQQPEIASLAIPGFRIVDTYSKLNGQEQVYQIQPENRSAPKLIETRYRPSFVPEGFELKNFADLTSSTDCVYAKNDQNIIIFWQYSNWQDLGYLEFHTIESLISNVKPVTVNGHYGYLINGKIERDMESFASNYGLDANYQSQTGLHLVWLEGDYEFVIGAEDLSEEEVIQIAESIQPMPDVEIQGYTVRFQKFDYDDEFAYHFYAENIPLQIPNFEKWYQPVTLPDGFSLNTSYGWDFGTMERILLYDKNGQNAIIFKQETIDTAYRISEKNIQNVRSISINGGASYILSYQADQPGFMEVLLGGSYQPQNKTFLSWNDGKYVFSLQGEDVSEEDLIKMAESIDFEYYSRYSGGIQNIDYEKMMENNPFPNKFNPYDPE